jgi:hypothetical protein
VLDRVAVHQTRLRTPGLGLDGKGVALGARGLVLLPSLDRLVAFLALYTSERSLGDLAGSLAIEVVRSKLATREVTLSFPAESSERMDRIAEVARLAGGFTFSGTSRHFVQYRDAGAPFGYDAAELLVGDAALVLYHSAFSQSYDVERAIPLVSLLARLELHPDANARGDGGASWVLAEYGTGGAFLHYLVRSTVAAEVGLVEWPPASSLEDEPVRRYLFRVAKLPERMVRLARATPGLSVFDPVAPGVAVELGHRHPISLRSCPVFDPAGLVLFRARAAPLTVARLPALGDVRAFARVELRGDAPAGAGAALGSGPPPEVAVTLRLLPSVEPLRQVTATWVSPEELPVLRRLAYALGTRTLRRASIAVTPRGAIVRHPDGVEAVPVGTFFREIHPGLYVPAGYTPVPAVAPEVLHRALGAPVDRALFVLADGEIAGVPLASFVSLEDALLEGPAWAPLDAAPIATALATALSEVTFAPLGFLPMRDVGDEKERDVEPG